MEKLRHENQCWNHLKTLKMIKGRVKPGTLSLKHPIFTSSMQGSSKSSFSALAHDKICSHCNRFFTSCQWKQSLVILKPLSTWISSSLTPLSPFPPPPPPASSSPSLLTTECPKPSASTERCEYCFYHQNFQWVSDCETSVSEPSALDKGVTWKGSLEPREIC